MGLVWLRAALLRRKLKLPGALHYKHTWTLDMQIGLWTRSAGRNVQWSRLRSLQFTGQETSHCCFNAPRKLVLASTCTARGGAWWLSLGWHKTVYASGLDNANASSAGISCFLSALENQLCLSNALRTGKETVGDRSHGLVDSSSSSLQLALPLFLSNRCSMHCPTRLQQG